MAALTALAISHPVLDVFGKSPEIFIFRGVRGSGILAFALIVGLAPLLAMSVLGLIGGLGGRTERRWVHLFLAAILLTVVALQVLKRVTPLLHAPLLIAAVVAGVALTAAIFALRLSPLVRGAALALPITIALFLFSSPVAGLVREAPEGARAAEASRTPIVIVLLDEFPLGSLLNTEGEINETLYPNFAALAREWTWYRNFTTVERQTQLAVPTMLTGKSVTDRSKKATAVDHPDNLFSLLSESHDLQVTEVLTALCSDCPANEAARSPEERAGDDLGPVSGHGGLPALVEDSWRLWLELSLPRPLPEDVTARFQEEANQAQEAPGKESKSLERRGPESFWAFLDSLRTSEKPSLYYLHLMLPHTPWKHFPSGVRYTVHPRNAELPFTRSEYGRAIWIDDPWPVELMRQRYLLQLQFTDRLMERLVQRLREVGLYDEALVIVTSDHGASFQAGRPYRLTASKSNLHEVVWVPMFMKLPHQREGGTDDRNLDITDLVPTIADVLDIRIPWKVDGKSMLDPATDKGPVKRLRWSPNNEVSVPHAIRIEDAQRVLREEAFNPTEHPTDPEMWPYFLGPGSRWIGAPLDDFRLGPPADNTATIDLPLDFGDVDPTRGPLPAFVWGTLREPRENRLVIASLNGRVAGASTVYEHRGPGRFAMLMPEKFFKAGANEFRLFLLEGDSLLRPLSIR